MKLYRVSFHDADEGLMISWHASKREADAALRKWHREFEQQGVAEVDAVDVPTTKRGLIDWLNVNLTLDNG